MLTENKRNSFLKWGCLFQDGKKEKQMTKSERRKESLRGPWLAPSEQHATLDLGGCRFKPHMGCRITQNKIFKKKKRKFVNSRMIKLNKM